MLLEKKSIDILKKAVEKLESGFDLPEIKSQYNYEKIEEILLTVAERMRDNYPYFHPYYVGQMLKPPHPIARVAYMLSMWINPNNHALDGGRASSRMEKEAVKEIAKMFGFQEHLGHLTGGGTMANLEALWVAGKIHPEKIILASDQAHYTHQRISEVLGLSFAKVPTDCFGKIDVEALEEILKKKDVGTVVCTMGTTGVGAVDPLADLLELKKKYHFRIHADAAYGGYFTLASNLRKETIENYNLLREVDSIVIDPHKHGLQPYGCGCVLFKDPSVSKFYLHDSPYTYYSSDEIHLGEISLECSRAGAAAVGLWATQKMFPLERGGEFSAMVESSREAALDFYERLCLESEFVAFFDPELDIVIWSIDAKSTKEMSEKAEKFFLKAEKEGLYFSVFKYSSEKIKLFKEDIEVNSSYTTCLRSCFIKQEHHTYLDQIWSKLKSIELE